MSDETNYIVCLTARPENQHVPSNKDICSLCGAEVWISPASVEMAAKHSAKIKCSDCFFKTIDTLPENAEVRIKMPSQEQIEEIKRSGTLDKEEKKDEEVKSPI
jgi:rRNA maturation endonuclease Nob1